MEMFEKQARIRTKKITRKRGKCEEEKDRISGLPDCILVEILSRLPDTKEAIRTGTLSKRWKHVWTYVFNLTFHFCNDAAVHMLSNFVSSVDKTLTQCRQLKLNKFQLYTVCDAPFVSQVNNWIRYAFDCKVEELDLRIWPPRDLKLEFSLHYLFYMNSRFRDLKVTGPVLNPTGAISWKQLRSLCISEGKLDEDLIENILSGSPLLETLELEACHGYSRLDITSKSVKNLVFSGYWGPQYDEEYFDDYFSDDDAYDEEYFDDYFSDDDAYDDFISINAPCILSLTIKSYVKLGKLLLLDVSSLVKAELCYTTGGLNGTPKKAEEEMLKGFILDLHHVEELQIGVPCIKALSCLEAKGFIIPSNLKVSDVT